MGNIFWNKENFFHTIFHCPEYDLKVHIFNVVSKYGEPDKWAKKYTDMVKLCT